MANGNPNGVRTGNVKKQNGPTRNKNEPKINGIAPFLIALLLLLYIYSAE